MVDWMRVGPSPGALPRAGLSPNGERRNFAVPARLPEGQRIYAVGDVHGCLDALRAIHAAIAEDLRERPVARASLVHLGDYIDRGPDSAGVLSLLSAGEAPAGIGETVNLLGNHEDLFLAAFEARTAQSVALWLMNGGGATLASWDRALTRCASRPDLSRGAGEVNGGDWRDRIPPEHVAFMRGLALTWAAGPYLFVHAGLRPGMPLERQTREDLIWIRQPFLYSDADFGAVVVHGHTPMGVPEVRPNRIGVDTGAFAGGRLTCAVLEQDEVGFIQR